MRWTAKRRSPDYFYYDRDRYRQGTTETSLVEYDIYKYYENCPDSHIDQLWENTLLDLLNSSEYDMMLSFEYFGGQFLSEVSGHAPFRFHPESYRTLQTVIEKNQKKLLKYKEWYEFGNNFAGGAYEWAQSVGQSLNKDYRKMGRVFAMHDDHGTRYVFRIHERKSAGGGGETSGYGWRDWLFFCHENDVPYLLQYNDCSEGCGWFAVPLSHEDVLKIVQGPDEEDERSDKNAAYRLWSAILWEHNTMLWSIYLSMLGSLFLYKYIKLKKKHELILAIALLTISLAGTVWFALTMTGVLA